MHKVGKLYDILGAVRLQRLCSTFSHIEDVLLGLM
jgi:hypothetical protein